MEGSYEKSSSRKWRESLSNFISPHLPAIANRMMPPTNLNDNATHVKVYSISGRGMSPDSGPKSPEAGPKSPTFSDCSFEGPVCRICHDVSDASGNKKLISPCGCTGSAQYVHKQCLQKWTKLKGASECEICHKTYQKKYVKFKMTSSEENTVASAITILLLLIGVLSVGVYLLAEYLVKVKRDPEKRGSNEIWVSVSLITIGMIGLVVFLPWFICFCARSGKTPRSNQGDEPSSTSDSPADTSLESSLANLSDIEARGGDGVVVDSAQFAYEQQSFEASGYADDTTSDVHAQVAGTQPGAYVNQMVQVDGLDEDNVIYGKDNPAVLFV